MEILSSRVLLRPRDLERSLRFYEDTLGLVVYRPPVAGLTVRLLRYVPTFHPGCSSHRGPHQGPSANGGGALGGAELLARRALLTAALLECLLRLLLLQLFRLRGALHHDLPADPDPLSHPTGSLTSASIVRSPLSAGGAGFT